MVTGTEHLEPEEGLKVVEATFSKGVKKVILTHVEHPTIDYSVAQQKEAVSQGAYVVFTIPRSMC